MTARTGRAFNFLILSNFDELTNYQHDDLSTPPNAAIDLTETTRYVTASCVG